MFVGELAGYLFNNLYFYCKPSWNLGIHICCSIFPFRQFVQYMYIVCKLIRLTPQVVLSHVKTGREEKMRNKIHEYFYSQDKCFLLLFVNNFVKIRSQTLSNIQAHRQTIARTPSFSLFFYMHRCIVDLLCIVTGISHERAKIRKKILA